MLYFSMIKRDGSKTEGALEYELLDSNVCM